MGENVSPETTFTAVKVWRQSIVPLVSALNSPHSAIAIVPVMEMFPVHWAVSFVTVVVTEEAVTEAVGKA